MAQRRRDQHLQFYVTAEEKEIIDQNVERSKTGNFSNFIRQLALGYEPRPIDFSQLRELNKQLGYMNRNLHQRRGCDKRHQELFQRHDGGFVMGEISQL